MEAERGRGREERWRWHCAGDHSELVRIFLWEKDADAAWREAQAGGCANDLWMELAAKREPTHPEDSPPIYQRQIGPTLDGKNNEANRQAVELLPKVRRLMFRLDRESEFETYFESILSTHKPKRNFIEMLNHAK